MTRQDAALDEVPVDRLLAPFRAFTGSAAAGGILLMAAAVVALLAANSPLASSWTALWQTPLTIGLGEFGLSKPLQLWINDGLMAIFFLVVGLEIKREVLVGELASFRAAALPLAGAVGGAALPALIFIAIASGAGPEAVRGWGVPMATDIAFALGVLALVGSRVPVALRVFLTALAIVDDLLAVLVIAVFYTSDVSMPALGAAALTLGALVVSNRLGVRRPLVYGLLGIGLWVAVLQSGVHATVAGVLLALTIPASVRLEPRAFAARVRDLLLDIEDGDARNDTHLRERHAALWDLEDAALHAQAPMLRIEHALHPWVALFIVPVFALANAGVTIEGNLADVLAEPVVLGIAFGLVVGKQLGITAATWLVLRAGLASLPAGLSWRHIHGAAWLGGIGFTMSLFIADLAYQDPATLALAKVGILAASVVAGLGGFVILRATAGRLSG